MSRLNFESRILRQRCHLNHGLATCARLPHRPRRPSQVRRDGQAHSLLLRPGSPSSLARRPLSDRACRLPGLCLHLLRLRRRRHKTLPPRGAVRPLRHRALAFSRRLRCPRRRTLPRSPSALRRPPLFESRRSQSQARPPDGALRAERELCPDGGTHRGPSTTSGPRQKPTHQQRRRCRPRQVIRVPLGRPSTRLLLLRGYRVGPPPRAHERLRRLSPGLRPPNHARLRHLLDLRHDHPRPPSLPQR
mmetsp:Transcript_8193/g.25327  ORF Transcript_8193/g.25327 Transcript_8193/m.25327 type:complete len:247 (-) Transcript_8193:455-1195(-)